MSTPEPENESPTVDDSEELILHSNLHAAESVQQVLNSKEYLEMKAKHELAEQRTAKVQRIQQLSEAELPLSYRSNTSKEELVIEYVETFCDQFESLYPHRRPLYLLPKNECGIRVCAKRQVQKSFIDCRNLYVPL